MPRNHAKDIRESGDLTELMFKFSLPCIISLLVGALYNIVDQIFIANADYLGSYGNAANSVVYPLTVIALAIAVTFGDGESSFLSIALGSGDRDNAHRSVGTCISTVLIISVIITLIYAVFQDGLITLFGGRVNDETFACAKEYFTWITMGIPFYMFGQSMAGTVSSDGNPKYTMFCTLSGAIANTILDPIFIYIFRWGMMGAALATILGQILVAFLFLAYLPRLKSVRLVKDSFRIRTKLLRRIIPLGMNTFFAQASIVLSMAAVNNMARIYAAKDVIFGIPEYSQIPTAVIGIVMKFFQIVISVSIGISAGAIPVVGYNVGAGRYDRVIGIMKRILIAETALGLIACAVFELFPHQLVTLFGSANESVYYSEFAVSCIRIFLSLIVLSCLNKGIMIFMQALGRPKQAISISVLREVVLGVGLPLIFPMFMGLTGLLYFMPAADFLTIFVSASILLYVYRRILKPGSEKALAGVQSDSAEEETEVFISRPDPAEALTSYVITIGRSYGGGGRSVGRMLAEALHIPFYDSDVIEKTAEQMGLDSKYIEHLDEKPVKSSVLYQYNGMPIFGPGARDRELERAATKAQQEIIRMIAAEGPCVIVGRRADQILDEEQTFRVFLTASEESRIGRISVRDGLSREESAAKIERVDRERAMYYRQYAGKSWGSAENYDLCIDTDKFGYEAAAKLVMRCVGESALSQRKSA